MPVIVGAGGHAKVVLDALLAAGVARDAIELRDGNPARAGERVLGFEIHHPEGIGGDGPVHVAIGSNIVRARLAATAHELVTIIHPTALVAASASIGAGSFIAARAIVGPDARVGAGVIVNHGAVVDHDCVVGDFAHIAPGAVLGGGASVGAQTLVGAGAILLPAATVGRDVTVGAGAVVLRAIGDGETWAGNPATKLG